MVTVSIDTSGATSVSVGLKIDGKEDLITQPLEKKRTQLVLPVLRELLAKHNLSFSDITAIEVNPGPGSFTGIRVGISIANALSLSLGVPVNGKKDCVEPFYERLADRV